jgi:hypothetical protein
MIAAWRSRAEPLEMSIARAEAVRLAKRINVLDKDLHTNRNTLAALIHQTPAAGLLDLPGIGPVTAAVVLAAWSHPGRIRSEAAFANLAGVSPIPASSGNTVRHRLNYGGDRRLNRALHMAIVTRMRMDPTTRAYVERRTTQGRTSKEIRRCLIGATSPDSYTATSPPPTTHPAPPLTTHRRVNGLIELARRVARGFRDPDNYRLRMRVFNFPRDARLA